MEPDQLEVSKPIGMIFVAASIIFNIAVSFVYLATKFSNLILLSAAGATVVFLILPFTITLWGFVTEDVETKWIVSIVIILFYLVLELLLDYILMIPFREMLALHVFYIIALYAAVGNMIGISFRINRRWGFVVLITFFILLGCLTYLYLF